jgi:hypothetical protein
MQILQMQIGLGNVSLALKLAHIPNYLIKIQPSSSHHPLLFSAVALNGKLGTKLQ